MRTTPAIPEQFRRFAHPGYTNVFTILPRCTRFYCTETLFGDWDGATLLLAKDAAPTQAIRERAEREGDAAWRHSERSRGDRGGCRTNERLARLAGALPAGMLYGSATANMLCDEPGWSRSLPGFHSGPLHEYLSDVLRWVIASMPNLRAVACLGQEAWFLAATVLGQPEATGRGREYRDSERLLITGHEGRRIALSCHFHPSRGSNEQVWLGWSALGAYAARSSGPALAA